MSIYELDPRGRAIREFTDEETIKLGMGNGPFLKEPVEYQATIYGDTVKVQALFPYPDGEGMQCATQAELSGKEINSYHTLNRRLLYTDKPLRIKE